MTSRAAASFFFVVVMVLRLAGGVVLQGGVGFSFAPSGLCFPYGLGAATALAERGVLSPQTPLAGASGGALVAAVAALGESGGPTVDDSLAAALRVNAFCRDRGSARFQLRAALEPELDALLGHDVAERLNNREAPVGVGLLRFQPFPRGEVVTNFEDLKDVKAALVATSCIPFYFSPSPVAMFRGWPALDGFFGQPRPNFGAPDAPGAKVTVRIAPFEAKRVRLVGESISPSAPKAGDPDLSDLLACALGNPPVSDKFLVDLFHRGAKDAESWLDRGGLQRAIENAENGLMMELDL